MKVLPSVSWLQACWSFLGEDAAEGAARTYALSVNMEKSPDHYLLEAVIMMERERDLIKALGGLTN